MPSFKPFIAGWKQDDTSLVFQGRCSCCTLLHSDVPALQLTARDYSRDRLFLSKATPLNILKKTQYIYCPYTRGKQFLVLLYFSRPLFSSCSGNHLLCNSSLLNDTFEKRLVGLKAILIPETRNTQNKTQILEISLCCWMYTANWTGKTGI